jgi:hypothetical protein
MKLKNTLLSLLLLVSGLYAETLTSRVELISDAEALVLVKANRDASEARATEIRRSLKAVPALDQRVIPKNGSNILMRRVAPSKTPSLSAKSAINEGFRAVKGANLFAEAVKIEYESISLAANVYGDAYSKITWRDEETWEEFVVWTNISIRYLGLITSITDGHRRYDCFGFIYPYSKESEAARIQWAAELRYEAVTRWEVPPVTLSMEYYEYLVVADETRIVPEKLYRQLDVVLGYYLKERGALEVSYKNSQTMAAARQKDLKENPPIPVDSVTNFSPGLNSVYLGRDQ